MFKELKKHFNFLLFAFFVTLSTFSLSGCDKKSNYKITVNIEINGILHSASSIQELGFHKQATRIIDTSRFLLKGEAVPISLGEYGYVFMIVETPQYYNPKLFYAIKETIKTKFGKEVSWDIDLKNPPRFVIFKDIKNPKTVQQVHFVDYDVIDYYEDYKITPYSQTDKRPVMKKMPADAKKIYGKGVILKSIHVERTFMPITWGQIDKVLPWLSDSDDPNLNGGNGSTKFVGSTLADELQHSNFKRDF